MSTRTVVLAADQPGNCALLRRGDSWLAAGPEIRGEAGARLCGHGVCSVFPKLQAILAALPEDAPLPDDYLLCERPGCDAAFRMVLLRGDEPVPAAARRQEKGAVAATAILRKQGPFLTRLGTDLAAELVRACTTTRYQDKQVILKQGVLGEQLFIVGEGAVEVVRLGREHEENVLAALGAGECFGEMSILTGEATSAEVRAKGPAVILSLHKDALEALLFQRPALSRAFSKLLADRLKASNVSVESELSRGVLGKLSMISLLDLIQTFAHGRRTGTLIVNYAGREARLGLRNGNLIQAKAGGMGGDEAFYDVVCWPDGDFCFETNEPEAQPESQVKTDLMGLMMEAMRRLDEKRAADGSAQ